MNNMINQFRKIYYKGKDLCHKYPKTAKTLLGVRIVAYGIIGSWMLYSKGCLTKNPEYSDNKKQSKIEKIAENQYPNKAF